MNTDAAFAKLVIDSAGSAFERPATWMQRLPAKQEFLEFISGYLDLAEGNGPVFDLNDSRHIRFLISYSSICCAYESFGDHWLECLSERKSEYWNKTLQLILHGLVEACEIRKVSDAETGDIFISMIEELTEAGIETRDEFEEQMPEIFESLLRDEEAPRFDDVNLQAQQLISELESGAFSKYSTAATLVLLRIERLKREVGAVVAEIDKGFK